MFERLTTPQEAYTTTNSARRPTALDMNEAQTKSLAVVTGASSGIGFELARQFAQDPAEPGSA